MGNRRKSRELALQALFYMDMSKDDASQALRYFLETFTPPRVARPFFLKLVTGVICAKPAIDAVLAAYSSHWKLGRMSGVDRNILRIAAYELFCCDDIPPKVTINEAIDIGKKFGSEDSGAFINGILDSIHLAIENEGLQIDVSPPSEGIAQLMAAEPGEYFRD
jgi:N utilization substance protein B